MTVQELWSVVTLPGIIAKIVQCVLRLQSLSQGAIGDLNGVTRQLNLVL